MAWKTALALVALGPVLGHARGVEAPVSGGFKAAPEKLVVYRYHHETYGQTVGSSFKSALGGFLLVVFAFPVLYFNEKREAHMQTVFQFARKVVRTNVPSDKVDSELEGSLVHMEGQTSTSETLEDADFNISVTDCAKFRREAEMFQWVEHSREEETDAPGGGKDKVTIYTYAKEWKSEPVDSSSFQEAGHDNPSMPLRSADHEATNVSFGAFTLSKSLVGQMCKWEPLSKDEQPLTKTVQSLNFSLKGETYTTAATSPEVGDMKITFKKVPCGKATVLSLQKGSSFQPLTYALVQESNKGAGCFGGGGGAADHGPLQLIGALIEAGESIDEIAEETLSAGAMVNRAEKAQGMIRIILKFVGYVMFFGGFYMQFAFVPTLFRIIPFIGVWIQAFGNFFAFLSAFLLANTCWCFTVAIAWLVLRPAKGFLLLVAAFSMVAVPTVLASRA
eukprot:CAMPEP_0168378992 /NCGR_PEP_ID=MMETSP0228-20121227/11615_1 /TAXON_ID=133427 /ORGANISM="Protoceratium reticulatum, Strain CCCM 535 (=CCMP 1889)" /LENGTH=447 /DNA_ID=CAMNT_0008392013 /DNA_START=68 /DNA_END=1412 /DNA_ORIENTATION=+